MTAAGVSAFMLLFLGPASLNRFDGERDALAAADA
jgi:hypothetical protein